MRKTFRTVGMHFNPHHREGGDNQTGYKTETEAYFNPHHREGGDVLLIERDICNYISIHTTAKVVTIKMR